MNEAKRSRNGHKSPPRATIPMIITSSKKHGEPSLDLKFKYIEQALFVNNHFLLLIIAGVLGLIFSPVPTAIPWLNNNIEFINSLMLGIGVSGVICWIIAFKIRGEINGITWRACHVLLNICHILSVALFLLFFILVGIKKDGSISSLACGVFSSAILGIMLSMKYNSKY